MFSIFKSFATKQPGRWTTSFGRQNGVKLRRRTARTMQKHRPSRFSWHFIAVSGAIATILMGLRPRAVPIPKCLMMPEDAA